jgi:hypothetical protein
MDFITTFESNQIIFQPYSVEQVILLTASEENRVISEVADRVQVGAKLHS